MRAAVLFIISLAIVAVAGCTGGGNGDSADRDATPPEAPEETYGLVLNAGQPWQMDDHTRESFAHMAQRMESVEPDAAAAAELKAVGAELQTDIDGLIAGCTMTGAAHDELHKYLMAYIPAVGAMADQGSSEAARKVSSLLELYPRYFE